MRSATDSSLLITHMVRGVMLTETNPIVPRSHTLFFLCSPSAAVSFFAPAAPFPTMQGHFLPFFTAVGPARPATLRQLPNATVPFNVKASLAHSNN